MKLVMNILIIKVKMQMSKSAQKKEPEKRLKMP